MKGQTKNAKKTLCFALTIFFIVSMIAVALPVNSALAPATLTVYYLSLSPGSDATQLDFSWHTNATDSPVVRIWKQGSAAVDFTGTCSASTATLSGKYYNRVNVTGLETNTAYTYQLGDGNGNWTVQYTTKTANPDSFSYLVFGDPQVSSQTYGNNWNNTLTRALIVNPNLSFMAATGDEIDTSNTAQYGYFFTPTQIFSSLPLATCMGNHEGSSANNYVFYNPPNANTTTENYWYRVGNALFLVWNCQYGTPASMQTFLQTAISANQDATWRILNFHYDVYGQGSSHALSDGKAYRDAYVPVIDQFGIDVVFNGHDHFYSRSYPMKYTGNSTTSNNVGMQEPETFQTINNLNASVNPTGTVYFSLSSSSGQKYYSAEVRQNYTAFMQPAQTNLRQFSIVDMTTNTFNCTTYQINADNSLTTVDTYAIAHASTLFPAPEYTIGALAALTVAFAAFLGFAAFKKGVHLPNFSKHI